MVSAGNKAKRPASVNYTTKTIHHHQSRKSLNDETAKSDSLIDLVIQLGTFLYLTNTVHLY